MNLKNIGTVMSLLALGVISAIMILAFNDVLENIIDSNECMKQVEKVISFERTVDNSGKIHYFASVIGKGGEVCYDIELPPEEFYRLKATNEPLIH